MRRTTAQFLFALVSALAAFLALVPRTQAQDCDGWVALGDPTMRAGHALVYDSRRGVIIMFGGFAPLPGFQSSFNQSSETWEFDGKRWTFRTLEGPAPRFAAAMAYDSSRGVVVMHGGASRSRSATTFFNDTWEWDGNQWTLRSANGPMPYSYCSMAYDTAHDRMLMIGVNDSWSPAGQNNIWQWSGVSWSRVPHTGNWPTDPFHGIASDPVRGTVLLQSGTNTTFTWDGQTWSRFNMTGLNGFPSWPMRSTFDEERQRIVVALPNADLTRAGMQQPSFLEWTGSGWTLYTSQPLNMYSNVPCFHGATGRMFTVGFFGATSPVTTRVRVDQTWQPIPTRLAPPRKQYPTIAFDSHRAVTTLQQSANLDGSASTWELRGEAWRPRNDLTGATPSPFGPSSMLYDPIRRTTNLVTDWHWQWNGENWTRLNLRGRGSMAFDSARGVSLLVGAGLGISEWNGQAWTSRATGGLSDYFGSTRTIYDPARRGIVFISSASIAFGNPTHFLQTGGIAPASTWETIAPAGQTSGYDAAVAYDPGRGGIVLFGGRRTPAPENRLDFPNQTYFLPSYLTQWQPLSLRGPLGRVWADMVYDSVSERLIMFGGGPHDFHYSDTWKLAHGPARLARPPVHTIAVRGRPAELFTIAAGGGTIRYEWRKDGVVLQDSDRMTGTDTDTLTFSTASDDAAGEFEVTVSNPCGQATSARVTLRIRCAADIDDGAGTGTPDFTVDGNDLLRFLALFTNGAPGADLSGGPSPGTHDGAVSIDDLLYFLDHFETGC